MHISTIIAILAAMNRPREQREQLIKLKINTRNVREIMRHEKCHFESSVDLLTNYYFYLIGTEIYARMLQ